jgi:hypothetical protein
MRRLITGGSAAAVLLFGVALASSTAVQATAPPSEPAPGQAHPVVGAWLLMVDEFPDDPGSLVIFHADGTYVEADTDGSTGIGSWEATGPSSANLTFVSMTPTDGEESAPILTIRAAVEVSEDGQSFTGEFTIEFTAEGFPAGEYGPGHVSATRINVEPMGTPAGSLDELFFEEGTEPPGTPPADTEAAATEPLAPATTEPADTAAATTEPAGTAPGTTAPATTG